jgi:hypothetical protein
MQFQAKLCELLHLRGTRLAGMRALDTADCQGVLSSLHAEPQGIRGLSAMIVHAACDTGLFVFSDVV